MMLGCCPLLLLALLASAGAAPSGDLEEYPEIIPQKRAALVLDRLLIALQRALREEEALPAKARPVAAARAAAARAAAARAAAARAPATATVDGPRAAPLRLASLHTDMMGGAVGRKEWVPWREQGPPELDPAPPLHAALEDEMRELQRRGQAGAAGAARGRVVLRCYFNAITCF